MNATGATEGVLSVGLVLDWSNCPKLLLSVAALAFSDSLFRRLSEVELRSSDTGLFRSLVAGCCGCIASNDDEEGSRRGKRGRHRSVSRDSIAMLETTSRDSTRDGRHLAQPALNLCFAAAFLSASCVVHAGTARARWGDDAFSTADNSSSAPGGASNAWLASWSVDGGDDARLEQLALCCFWTVHGLLLLATTTLVLRRCLCPPLRLIYSAGLDDYSDMSCAAQGNVSAGIIDSVALLAAGAIVSGALPRRAQSEEEPPLSFLEQNIAAGIAVAGMVTAVVLFGILVTFFHFRGASVAAFVTDRVPSKYRLSIGGPIGPPRNLKSGNPVKATLYGACLVSYSMVLGKAAAASVELLHLVVWASAGCLMLLLVGAVLAKHLSSGFSRKRDFRAMAEKHNWGYGLVTGATVLAFGLAVTGLVPDRGCGASTATARASMAPEVHQNHTHAFDLFEVPSELAVLAEESLRTKASAAVLTPDAGVALFVALICMFTTRPLYQLPLRCVGSNQSAKKKRNSKNESYGFKAALQVTDCVTSGRLHAVSVSFAGYTVAMGNVLAATLDPVTGESPFGPRLSAALQRTSAASTNSTEGLGPDANSDTFVLDWQSVRGAIAVVWATMMPQLAWTGLSCAMMVVAHCVHLAVIDWQLPDKSGSDSEDDDDDVRSGVRMKAIERLRNNDCAYGVMEGGMHIVSSFIIAAACAGRGLTAREIAAGWLCFAGGELIVCAFGAATAVQERRRRNGHASDSDVEGNCCKWSTNSSKLSRKQEKREARRRKELMLIASHAPGPGQAAGQSLNWCLHLCAWVLLLLGAYRSSRISCSVDGSADQPLLPTFEEALPACVWAVLGSVALLAAHRIVMELVLSDVSDALYAELERTSDHPLTDSVENWGPGLVGGTVSVGMSIVLVGLLPPAPCA